MTVVRGLVNPVPGLEAPHLVPNDWLAFTTQPPMCLAFVATTWCGGYG
jgi:hypothetical protein